MLEGRLLVGNAGYSSFLHTSSAGSAGLSFSANKWKELLDNTDSNESIEFTEDDEDGRLFCFGCGEDPTNLNTESPNAFGVWGGVEDGFFGGRSGSVGDAESWYCSSQSLV